MQNGLRVGAATSLRNRADSGTHTHLAHHERLEFVINISQRRRLKEVSGVGVGGGGGGGGGFRTDGGCGVLKKVF
jgi:hypothetical protein